MSKPRKVSYYIIETNLNEINSKLKFFQKFDFYKFYFCVGMIESIKPILTENDVKIRNLLWKNINYKAYRYSLKYYNRELHDWKEKTSMLYNRLIQTITLRLMQLVNEDYKNIVIPFLKSLGQEVITEKILDEKIGREALLIVKRR